jgi:signal transduction histidine kinase/DNA-binding response OmpR family regulator/GAF domain-containing protein
MQIQEPSDCGMNSPPRPGAVPDALRLSTFSERILVVDDEPQILVLIDRLLQRVGYVIETARDGLAAIARLQEVARNGGEKYALVISDLKMPGADGLAVLREVTEHHPETMCVLITGFATLDSAVSALRQGAYDYLTKPLDLEHLVSTVRRALQHRALLLENEQLIISLRETADALRQRSLSLEQLHREEQRKAEQLRRVNAIARQITTLLDAKAVIDTMLDLLASAFEFAEVSFGLVADGMLVFQGGSLDGLRQPVAESMFWQMTGGGHTPFVRANGTEDLGTRQPGTGCDVIFPLLAGDQPLGLWVANWAPDASSRQADLPYLESLAAHTVAVLENARLYALARKADEMAFLNAIGRAANRSLDLQETVESVLGCLQGAFRASLVEVCLLDERQRIEQAFTLVDLDAPDVDVLPLCTLDTAGLAQQRVGLPVRSAAYPLLGEEFVRRVEASPVVTGQCGEVEAMGVSSVPGLGRLCSLIGVALHFGEQQIGVLGVASVVPGAYDVENGRLLQVVGGHVATAIENARLFHEVEAGRRTILESRNTLQTVFDGILAGIYIVDRERRVLAVNKTQADWAGQDVDSLVGQLAEKAFPDSMQPLALIEETFQTGKPASRDERYRSISGRWAEWEIHTYPIVLHEGDQDLDVVADRPVDRVVVVVRDVTEQRWLEASLLQSEKLAAVGTLAAGIAHEINNPMTVVSANAQILREEIPATHPYYSSIELIDRASERASKIVRSLLDFSRSEEFELMPTNVNRSIQESMSLVEPQLRKAGIQIATDLSPNLPPIWASPDHLHVVWLNLMLNARDAILQAGRPGEIRIQSDRQGDWVAVHMTDNGVGIPEDQINHLYEPFFTTKEPGKGTGLGLFTCYRTVARHGGEITIDSLEGEGTTFHVFLPAGQA